MSTTIKNEQTIYKTVFNILPFSLSFISSIAARVQSEYARYYRIVHIDLVYEWYYNHGQQSTGQCKSYFFFIKCMISKIYTEISIKIFNSRNRFLHDTLFFSPFITLIHFFCSLNMSLKSLWSPPQKMIPYFNTDSNLA
jgi:hypothetical protein